MRRLLLLLALALPVHAQIMQQVIAASGAGGNIVKRVGSAANGSTNNADTSVTVTYSPVVGNCLVVMVGTNGASTISSVVDNASPSNTYVPLVTSTNGNNGVGGTVVIKTYGLCNLPHVGTTVTVNYTSGIHLAAIVAEYNGAALGQVAINGSAGATPSGTTTLTTQASNNFQVASFFYFNGSTPSVTGNNTLLRSACPSGCDVTFTGDGFGAVDNTLGNPGSLVNTLSFGSTTTYSSAGVELSTNSLNVTQLATGTFCGSGTSCTANYGVGTIVGDTLVALVDYNTGITVSSVTHGADTGVICGTTTTNANIGKSAIYLFKNITTTGTGITANFSGSTFADVNLIEMNGANATSPCDATGTSANTDGGSTSTLLTPGASTATAPKTYAVDYCVTQSAGGPWTLTSTWLSIINTGGEVTQAKYFGTVQTNLNPQINASVAKFWTCQLASIASQ